MSSYQKFEELCKKQNMTPYKVSCNTGVATSTLSMWKNGKYTPKLDKLQKIAKALGVPITYFLEEEGNGQQNAGL